MPDGEQSAAYSTASACGLGDVLATAAAAVEAVAPIAADGETAERRGCGWPPRVGRRRVSGPAASNTRCALPNRVLVVHARAGAELAGS
jgi:hypothetical protein